MSRFTILFFGSFCLVLLVGPAAGYCLGAALERRWPIAPWGMGLGIALGLVASARVTIQFIRQAQDLDDE